MEASSNKEAFFEKLDEMREKDPLIGAKMGAEDIYARLLAAIKEPEGRVNCSNLMFNAASLAGYGCQAAVWQKYVIDAKMPVKSVFVVITTEDDESYYLGDAINAYMIEGKFSIWEIVSGMYKHLYPNEELPDVKDYVTKVESALGDKNAKVFGVNTPIEPFNSIWDTLKPVICRYCKTPDEWVVLFGVLLQKVLLSCKGVVPPKESMDMIMESALYMSKRDISSKMTAE